MIPKSDQCLDPYTASEAEISGSELRLSPINEVLPLVGDGTALNFAISKLELGVGAVAIDAERASGFKYYQRAYLIQLYRVGAPIVLIDPVNLDISTLQKFLNNQEWILHAATQDLPCLTELGLKPKKLFDTELAAKLIGLPKVGLAALTETLLNVSLAKEHSAVNWSVRPLDQDWLNYAALDVELLPELKTKLEEMLSTRGRSVWADEEFEKLKHFQANSPKPDPWRRTSGIHELPNRRQKEVVRQLWLTRDNIAKELDLAPGRLVNDRVLISLAKSAITKLPIIEQIRKSVRGVALDYIEDWYSAIELALNVEESELPRTVRRESIVPHPKSWEEINPEAFARWTKYRLASNELAAELEISPEVLIAPEILRNFCWELYDFRNQIQLETILQELGAKKWATQLLAQKFINVNL